MNNRAGEMEVFVEVMRRGSFAAAGRALGLSPSTVGKLVNRLESRFGTRLLARSTRSLALTHEGEIYLRRARHVLAEIEDAERALTSGACSTPRGLLRIHASVPFTHCALTPLLPAFLSCYPDIEVDLSLDDGIINLIENRTDVAIRVGALPDSSLKTRKLLESPYIIVASPSYLADGPPLNGPEDLVHHQCIACNMPSAGDKWSFKVADGGTKTYVGPRARVRVNNGETVRRLAVSSVGLARIARYHVQPDIDAGLLVQTLQNFDPDDVEVVSAVYVGHEHLAGRIRAFLDFFSGQLDSKKGAY